MVDCWFCGKRIKHFDIRKKVDGKIMHSKCRIKYLDNKLFKKKHNNKYYG